MWREGDVGGVQLEAQVMEEIDQRTADAMVAKGCPFRGVLFAGLMVSAGKVSPLYSICG